MKRCNRTVIRTFNKDNGNRYFCLTLCHRLDVRVSPRPHPTARVSCRNPDPSDRVRRVGASWTGSVPLQKGPQRAARSPSVSVPELVSPPCEDVSLHTDAVPHWEPKEPAPWSRTRSPLRRQGLNARCLIYGVCPSDPSRLRHAECTVLKGARIWSQSRGWLSP